MVKGPYDFYVLVTCLLILALQIHNPFQSRHQCVCHGDGNQLAASVNSPVIAAQTASKPFDSQQPSARPPVPAPPPIRPDPSPVYRRPREATSTETPTAGLSTDALLRELDKIQVKAKEQQETLAAAGRMPPASPILQQLKESEASTAMNTGNNPLMDRNALSGARPSLMSDSAARPAGPAIADTTGAGRGTPQMNDVPLLRRRSDFGRFLEQRQPRGLGIVLGVGHGDFAIKLLEDWVSVQGVYLVDPYIHIFRGYNDPANVDDREHQMIFENLRNKLLPFEGRHVLIRDFSYSFAETYQRGAGMGQPTFVYVDNNHVEEAVNRDLDYWWPLLANGGCLAGSTYTDDPGNYIGVRTAVDRFAMRQRVKVYLTHDDMPPSWFVFKL